MHQGFSFFFLFFMSIASHVFPSAIKYDAISANHKIRTEHYRGLETTTAAAAVLIVTELHVAAAVALAVAIGAAVVVVVVVLVV